MNKNSKPLLILSILGAMGSFGYIITTVLAEIGSTRPGRVQSQANGMTIPGSSTKEAKAFEFALNHDPFANSLIATGNTNSPIGQISISPNGGTGITPSVNSQSGVFPVIPGQASGPGASLPPVMSGQINPAQISINGEATNSGQSSDPSYQSEDSVPTSPQNPRLQNPQGNEMTNQTVSSQNSNYSPNGGSNATTTNQSAPGVQQGNAPRTAFPRIVLKGVVEGSNAMAYLEISGNKTKAFSVGTRPLSGVLITGITSTGIELTYLGEAIRLTVGQEVELK